MRRTSGKCRRHYLTAGDECRALRSISCFCCGSGRRQIVGGGLEAGDYNGSSLPKGRTSLMPLELHQLQKLDDYRWLIPRGTRPGMLTDALIYSDENLLKDFIKDLSLEQAINVAMLPGIVGRSLAMPDIHQGYGFPIGGVAATQLPKGVVSPGGVGFDINCGVRLLGSNLSKDDVRPKLRELVNQLFRDVPSGTGSEG